MSVYGPLAPWYDALTGDVPYEAFADYYEALFARRGKDVRSVIDLACGTGSLSVLLARRGYEVIAVDRSADMLAEAMEKFSRLPESCTVPMLLCQDLAALDLYGTSDAAVCCLDGVNYLSREEAEAFFTRLRYFLEPGGLLIFDIHAPEHLRSLDGELFVDEQEDVLCLWRASLSEDDAALVYGMDVFERRDDLWDRQCEEHVEYIHQPEALKALLEKASYYNVEIRADGPLGDAGRLFVIAENGWYHG